MMIFDAADDLAWVSELTPTSSDPSAALAPRQRPMETTGQRYVFSGSACGAVYVYDVLTGEVAAKLQYHNAVVRDCDWHPSQPVLASVGWDGYVARWANFDAPWNMLLIVVTEDVFHEPMASLKVLFM